MTLHRWGRSQGGWAIKAAGGGGPVVPALPTVDTTNLVNRWQPDHSTVTKSGSEVLTATNIVTPGTMDLSVWAAGSGAIEMTETNPTSPMFGRKFWRFDANQAMKWTGGSISTTNMAVFFVCRSLRSSRGWALFSLGTAGAGNTNAATLNISITSQIAPWIRNASISANSVATSSGNAAKHMMGCQPQVLGVAAGSGAGASRMYMNSDALTVAGPNATTLASGAIGLYAHSAGAKGLWAEMDVFDILVYNARPSNAVSDSIAAALQAGYSIPSITDSMVFEGDSLVQGFPGDADPAYRVTASTCVTGGQWMTIPAGYRVLNVAVSGNATYQVYTRLSATNGPHSANAMIGGPLSGHNRVCIQVGGNDAATGNSFTASIAGTTMTVTAITPGQFIGPGDMVAGTGVSANTVVVSQTTGTAGLTGDYVVNNSQTVGPVTMGGDRAGANIYSLTGATSSVVSLISDASFGFKLNYDKIFQQINIAHGNSAINSTIEIVRTAMRDISQFRTDTGTTATNLNNIDLQAITFGSLGGLAYFSTSALAVASTTTSMPSTAVYQNDSVHPTGTSNIPHPGNEYMVKGGAWDGGTGSGLNSAFL